MSVYDRYATDAQVEVEGVYHTFDGGFKLRIARAGGGNRNYIKAIAERAEEFRNKKRAELVEAGTMADIYAEAIITDVEDPDGEFVGQDGEPIKVGSPQMAKLLRDLPELFLEIQRYATDRRYYKIIGETTAKK